METIMDESWYATEYAAPSPGGYGCGCGATSVDAESAGDRFAQPKFPLCDGELVGSDFDDAGEADAALLETRFDRFREELVRAVEQRIAEVFGDGGPVGGGGLPLSTKGDLLVHNGYAAVRLPVGTDRRVLTADSLEGSGLKWSPGGDLFGRGGDGDVTYGGGASLTRDMYFRNLTVLAGGDLDPAGFRIFVAETLTIAATGTIRSNGGAGGAGVSGTGGAAGTPGGGATATPLARGGAGAAGGSAGGSGTLNGDPVRAVESIATARAPADMHAGCGGSSGGGHGAAPGAGALGGASVAGPGSGGEGGGGTGTGSAALGGGGGGGGGGIVRIYARKIVNSGAIEAKGGAGGAGEASGATKAGNGGGGGGGAIILVYSDVTSTPGTRTVSAGAAGSGGNGGTTGSAGTSLAMQVTE